MDNKNIYNEFKGQLWKDEINVADFIRNNYKEYKGDDTFLAKKSKKTKAVWEKCEKLLKQPPKQFGSPSFPSEPTLFPSIPVLATCDAELPLDASDSSLDFKVKDFVPFILMPSASSSAWYGES